MDEPLSEEEIVALEELFPTLAGAAFAEERRKTLEAGLSVLSAKDGVIYEVFPDGRREIVKHIEPPIIVPKGMRIQLR